jgi:AcrR family transcriptional regulator
VTRTPPPVQPDERAPARKRGPVPKLSIDKIAAAVVAVGFDAASVTSVAQHLGVTHAALYRYIDDRDGMMRAALERATGAWEWPELVDDWREVLWNEARSWWKFCQHHPGFVGVLASTPGMPRPMSRRTVQVAVRLRSLGIASGDALIAVDLMTDTIHDIFHRAAQREGVIEGVITMSPEDAAEHLEGVPDDMVEVIVNALIGDPWPWFSRKLELIIDGLAARSN